MRKPTEKELDEDDEPAGDKHECGCGHDHEHEEVKEDKKADLSDLDKEEKKQNTYIDDKSIII